MRFCDWIVVSKSFFIIHSRPNANVQFTLSKTITYPSNSAWHIVHVPKIVLAVTLCVSISIVGLKGSIEKNKQ